MKTLQLSEEKAQKLFKKASPEFKEVLVDTFGEQCFSEKITDRIKTFQNVKEFYRNNNIAPKIVFCETDTKDERAYKKLKLIARVINQGWTPDWDDNNQKKWYPWFSLSSGFGFSGSDYLCTSAGTAVGSRLCFPTQELSNYVAIQFIDIYKAYLT